MGYTLYDFLDHRGRNVIRYWGGGLEKTERSKLNFKLDMLEKHGEELFPSLLTPTKERHIKELVIKGKVAIRLLLCRGPIDMQSKEFTLLLGARERDRKYVPKDALTKAEENRQTVLHDTNRRILHERIDP